jgi:hypothetical protein
MLSLMTFMEFELLLELLNFVGFVFLEAIRLGELVSFQIYPDIGTVEGFFIVVTGAFAMYFLPPSHKIAPPLIILLYLFAKSILP